MKKILFAFPVIALLAAGCSSLQNSKKDLGGGYSTEGSSIYVIDKCTSQSFESGECSYSTKKVTGADIKTFQTLSSSQQNDAYGFAKDKNYVYLLGQALANADAATFKNLGYGYFEDKNSIYFVNTRYFNAEASADSNLSAIVGANNGLPALAANDSSFVVYNQFAKDSRHVYYNGKIVSLADTSTFHKFNDCYFVDKNRIYVNTNLGIGQVVDIPTLKSVNGSCNYLKDKNFVYNYGQIVQGANPATFSPVQNDNKTVSSFSTDNNNVYVNNQLLPGADPKTFHSIGLGYFSDATHVWYQEIGIMLLTGVDPKTVNTNYNCNYITDKNGAYYDYEKFTKLEGSDSATFQEIPKTCYAKDKNQVYHLNQIITGADPATFVVIGNQEYSKDKNHVYKDDNHGVNIVPGADPNIFQPPQ